MHDDEYLTARAASLLSQEPPHKSFLAQLRKHAAWSALADDAMLVGTVRDAAGWPVTVRRTVPRGWSADGGRTVHSFALLAAEAIEAAIRLEVMVAGGYPARERGGAS